MRRPSAFDTVETLALWNMLEEELKGAPVVVTHRRGVTWSPRKVWNIADDAIRNAGRALLEGMEERTHATLSFVRREVVDSARVLMQLAAEAAELGADTASRILMVLAYRTSLAAGTVGTNMRKAFRNFWGLPPEAPAYALMFLAVGALLLALTPPGQALIATALPAAGGAAGRAGRALFGRV